MALDMIVDVEALVLTIPNYSGVGSPKKKIYIVEQAAYLLYDREKNVCGEGHFFICQPDTDEMLAKKYNVPIDVVQKSIENYERITGDHYLHDNSSNGDDDDEQYYDWCSVRKGITKNALDARHIYAKGINLERSVFYGSFKIWDLGVMGCPCYPEAIHNPLKECKFFLTYAPVYDE